MQAVAYLQLVKWLGPHRVRGEYPARLEWTYPGRRGDILKRKSLRLDIVILDEDASGRILVIEIKRAAQDTRCLRRQLQQYPRAAGCPIITINGMAEASRAAEIVRAALEVKL